METLAPLLRPAAPRAHHITYFRRKALLCWIGSRNTCGKNKSAGQARFLPVPSLLLRRWMVCGLREQLDRRPLVDQEQRVPYRGLLCGRNRGVHVRGHARLSAVPALDSQEHVSWLARWHRRHAPAQAGRFSCCELVQVCHSHGVHTISSSRFRRPSRAFSHKGPVPASVRTRCLGVPIDPSQGKRCGGGR